MKMRKRRIRFHPIWMESLPGTLLRRAKGVSCDIVSDSLVISTPPVRVLGPEGNSSVYGNLAAIEEKV
jgi:hypothetical protein